MSSSSIGSMTMLRTAQSPLASSVCPSAESLPISGPVLEDLSRLSLLLEKLTQSLASGNAGEVPQVCEQVILLANQVTGVCLQGLTLSRTEIDALPRRKLLEQMRRKSVLCSAMLRRWRRRMAVQQQSMRMDAELKLYTETLTGGVDAR
jgi:hypothetical protein